MKTIVQGGAKVLRETATAVSEDEFGSSVLRKIIADMTAALDKEPDGVAIAAPQIGVSKRVFIVRTDRTLPLLVEGEPARQPEVEIYINPEILRTSRRKAKTDEGCLSVRGVYGTTERHERVTVRAHKEDGSQFTRGAGGLLAQIFEHEVDHLNGILFIDHATHLVQIPTNDHEPVA